MTEEKRSSLLNMLINYLSQMKTAHEHRDDKDWYYEDSPMVHRVNRARKQVLLEVVSLLFGQECADRLLEEAMQMLAQQELDKLGAEWYS